MKEPTIVILSCDQHLAEIYTKKFQRQGWVVSLAEDLETAEKKSIKLRPQILLLDTECSIDILVDVKRLQALPTMQQTKIVLMTHRGDKKLIEEAHKLGVSGFLIFGHFSPHEIAQTLKKLIE